MTSSRAARLRRYARYEPHQLGARCVDCGAPAGSTCWDMRFLPGVRTRTAPHPTRGRPGARISRPLAANARERFEDKALNPANRGRGNLTALQRLILDEICHGATNETVARRLNIGLESAKLQVKDLLWRLNASCRAHAVHEAYQRGILKVAQR